MHLDPIEVPTDFYRLSPHRFGAGVPPGSPAWAVVAALAQPRRPALAYFSPRINSQLRLLVHLGRCAYRQLQGCERCEWWASLLRTASARRCRTPAPAPAVWTTCSLDQSAQPCLSALFSCLFLPCLPASLHLVRSSCSIPPRTRFYSTLSASRHLSTTLRSSSTCENTTHCRHHHVEFSTASNPRP